MSAGKQPGDCGNYASGIAGKSRKCRDADYAEGEGTTHLAYAPEIASAMLQRQQAAAIIDARQKIVEGAVGMVEMALAKLNEQEIVESG